MSKFRRTIAVCLIAVLGIVSFTSCGQEEEKKAEAPKRTPLKSSVTMTVADGDAFSTVSKLSGDIKVDKVKNQEEVIRTLKSGKCDFAVLTPIEAARYYNENGGIKVVSTLSLGDWTIAETGYEGDPSEEEDLARLGGQTMVGINDDLVIEEDETTVDETAVEEPVVEDPAVEDSTVEDPQENIEENPEELTEPEEPIILKNMGEEVFQTLMAKEKYGFYDGQISWQNITEGEEYLADTGARVLTNKTNLKKILGSNEEYLSIYSLGDMWNKDFGSEIPGYVLVATDKFLSERNYEVEGVLDVIADTIEENQKGTDLKLVAYNLSNRGVVLVRDFIDTLMKYNPDAIDSQEVPVDFYWNGK